MLAKIIKIKGKTITIERQDGKTVDIEKESLEFKYKVDDIIRIERNGKNYVFSEYRESDKAKDISDFYDDKEDEDKNTLLDKNSNLKGIRGWLGLYVASSILGIATDIIGAIDIGNYSSGFFHNTTWNGSANLLIAIESALIPVIIVLRIIYLIQICKHKKAAIHRTIFLHSLWLVLTFVEISLVLSMYGGISTVVQSRAYVDYLTTVVASSVTQIIWIIYFAKSKRVKNTLTK